MQSPFYGFEMRQIKTLLAQWMALVGAHQLAFVADGCWWFLFMKIYDPSISSNMAFPCVSPMPKRLLHHAITFFWVWNEANKTLLAMNGSSLGKLLHITPMIYSWIKIESNSNTSWILAHNLLLPPIDPIWEVWNNILHKTYNIVLTNEHTHLDSELMNLKNPAQVWLFTTHKPVM